LSADQNRIKELERALEPFVRVYRLNEQLSANWNDGKPVADVIPGAWPVWSDLKRINVAYGADKKLPV
jgi:hypothetical protein